MRHALRHCVIIAAAALVLAGCGKFKKAEPAKPVLSAQECVEASVFGANSFQNDCMGLKIAGGASFLYGGQKTFGASAAFAVPSGDFSVKISLFSPSYRDLKDEVVQQRFSDGIKQQLLKTPGLQVVEENITEINNIPVVYLRTVNGDRAERNFYFQNRGRWVMLTLAATQQSLGVNAAKQDAFMHGVSLY